MRRQWGLYCSIFLVTFSFFLGNGCQQKMAQQPSYKPLRPSDFFGDGRSARPLVPGTVAWDFPQEGRKFDDSQFLTGKNGGKKAGGPTGLPVLPPPGQPLNLLGPALVNPATYDYAETFPYPVTTSMLKRGQDRYSIYCLPCHGSFGNGDGKIVERGYLKPPSYHSDLSRGYQRRGIQMPLTKAPVGYFFEVITQGFGGMPDYSTQVVPEDRWAIISYIRALQIGQNPNLAAFYKDLDAGAPKAKEGKP